MKMLETKRTRFVGILAVLCIFMITLFYPSLSPAHDPVPGPNFLLEDTVILTDGDIDLGIYFYSEEGNICSRNGNISMGAPPAGSGVVEVPIGAPANTDGDVIAATGNIILGNYSRVGHARGNVIITPGAQGVKTNLIDPAMTCPDNPPFPSFSSGAGDITCSPAGTDIVPGNYQDLIVPAYGVCNFRGPGDYNFRRVIAATNTKYEFNFLDPPAQCDPNLFPYNLNVKDFMYLGEFGLFNQGETKSVFVHVEGTDGTYGGSNPAPNGEAFFYRGDGIFLACWVFAPNGTIGLRGAPRHINHAEYHALWIGKAFRKVDTRKVVVALPLNFTDCCIKTKDCACIQDFFDPNDLDKTVAAGDPIRLLGKGFKSSTVSQVLFFDVNNKTPDITDPAATADCKVLNTDASFSFVSESVIDLNVPATCPSGTYRLGIVNDGFCIDRVTLLTIP